MNDIDNYKSILFEEKDQIVILTLNRPRVLNAINMNMLKELAQALAIIRSRDDVRVIIITGFGEKSFSTGADLKERVSFNGDKVKEYILKIRDLFTSIEDINIPVIAGINGLALGGGAELSLACDIRIASSEAFFGLTETRLAIIPGAGGTQRLPRIVGPGIAKELIFTGRKIGAEEAFRLGLFNRICKVNLLIEECLKTAQMICSAGPIAIEQAKYAIKHGLEVRLKDGLEIESKAYFMTINTKDRLEGLNAFYEKRKPLYKGH